ncbi:MFS transporter [Leucobacter allii]|uniref:MFS transporter n=1 Tax=Leucobacter allii TaxID=2932247 RepID=UPI003211C997
MGRVGLRRGSARRCTDADHPGHPRAPPSHAPAAHGALRRRQPPRRPRPGFAALLAGRVATSFTHGAFFGIGAVVAAELVGPARRAAAVALMFTGLTLANLVGVPLGTRIGDLLGWRTTFVVIAAIGVLALCALARFVPGAPRTRPGSPNAPAAIDEDAASTGSRLRAELRALRDPQALLAILMTMLGFGGVFAVITYLAPTMTGPAGLPEEAVSWVLVVLGLGMVVGNWLGGRLADRAIMPTVVGSFAVLALALLAFVWTAHAAVPALLTVFVVGLAGFASVAPLQTLVLERAAGAPMLASAVNIGAFNLGNALAAWLAGAAIGAGHGYAATGWVGAALTGTALILALASAGASAVGRRRRVLP